jgi:hypothetical protein
MADAKRGGLRPGGADREPGQAGHVGDRLASPSRAIARDRPTARMTRLSRHSLGGEDVLDRDPDPRSAGVAAHGATAVGVRLASYAVRILT